MASKTVWIMGGLAIAVGAVAYLGYHETPAGRDAAGTIVEAKRAISENPGTNGSSSTSSTDPSGTNSSQPNGGADQGDANHQPGADGSHQPGADGNR